LRLLKAPLTAAVDQDFAAFHVRYVADLNTWTGNSRQVYA
jgi:hypothetical protein